MMFFLFLVYLNFGVLFAESVRYTVSDFPNDFAGYGDQVQFFYLQAPFPYNAPTTVT